MPRRLNSVLSNIHRIKHERLGLQACIAGYICYADVGRTRQQMTPLCFTMRIHQYTESFKKPGNKWRTGVGDLDAVELQRLEAKVRRDKNTASAGVGAATGVLVGSALFMHVGIQ